MNLMMLLEMAAGAYGDRIAFQNGDDRLTYQQLFNAAGALAATLDDGRTKHLAMLDESTLALPISVFGASWAGIPFAPLNYRLTDAELDSLIVFVARVLLIHFNSFQNLIIRGMLNFFPSYFPEQVFDFF